MLATGHLFSILESRTSRYDPGIIVDFRCSSKAVAEYERTRCGAPVDMRMKVTAPLHQLEPGTLRLE
jgi:hypothetical protein